MQKKFDDNRLQFNCNRIPVTQAEIIPVIIEAWNNQKHILQLQRMGLTFPISSDRIRQKFDRYAHQVKSGLFVVIHNSTNRCYYKYSLMDNEIQFYLLNDPNKAQLSVYPIGHMMFSSKGFFKYSQMRSPLIKKDIPTSVHLLIVLVNGTVKAFLNLHSSGYAHNDVRIENICFREEDREIVLIDLENVEKWDDKICMTLECQICTELLRTKTKHKFGRQSKLILGNYLS